MLLEVGGSRLLFGDLAALRGEIERAFAVRGWPLRYALAPTPQAALWLARGTPGAWIETSAVLPGALASVPLQALCLPPKLCARLEGFGIRRLGGVMRLPRAALARRTDGALHDALARALGERPDPRADWRPPTRFHAHRELECETDSDGLLRAAAATLFADLAAMLRVGDRGVRRCTVVLRHRDLPATRIHIGVLDPVQDAARLEEQFALRLGQTTVPAPVLAVALHASRLEQVNGTAHDLFAPRAGSEAWHTVLERLQARFGEPALQGLALRDDHRPERAWQCLAGGIGRGGVTGIRAPRPVWLLTPPREVGAAHYRIESGPERIESGWWDGDDVMRDYFVARDGVGARCWLFRERRPPHRWFLHGLFG